jgi:ferredoxin--NADP+ reductase
MDITALREAHYNAVILRERNIQGTVMVFRVLPDNPIPQPKPGQWLELGLGVWEPVREDAVAGSAKRFGPEAMIRRAYSISSRILDDGLQRVVKADEADGFEFFLSLVIPPAERAGKVPNLTGRLFRLGEGDRLWISDAPLGEYTLDPVGPEDDVLFLATGTGEAPHNAMIRDLLLREHQGRIASVVSVRRHDDLAYDAVHRRLTELFPRYRYHAFSTRDPESETKHLQDHLREGSLESLAGFPLDPKRVHVFVCGNPGMIGPPRLVRGERIFPDEPGVVGILEDEYGFSADDRNPGVNVHFERYW